MREQHREGGGAGEREGKGNSKENREKKNEVGRFRSKWFRSPRKGIGEEPRPFSVLSQLGWGRQGTRSGWGRGHVGCLGGFALDCSGVRPHQGAPTQPGGLGSRLRVSHCSGDQRPLPPLSPLDCLSGETGGLGGGRGLLTPPIPGALHPARLPALFPVSRSLVSGLGQPFTDLQPVLHTMEIWSMRSPALISLLARLSQASLLSVCTSLTVFW